MALALADEAFGRFAAQDFIDFGRRFRIPERATRRTLTRIGNAVIFQLRVSNGWLPFEPAVLAEMRLRAEAIL
jgi:hypothetical protein